MNPAVLLAAIFAILLLLAALFVCWPVLRARGYRPPRRWLLVASAIFVVAGLGGGMYLMLGTPSLALRTINAPKDVPSLIAALSQRARDKTFNVTGWTLLGRGYLTLGDAGDAAAAFRRAAQIAPPESRPGLLSAYGEALTMAASGAVTSDAEEAFRAALAGNPKDFAARYYLGLALAARGDNAGAVKIWEGLLADTPPGAPWRGQLLDHLAALRSQTGGTPNISAMVAGLAARLKNNPNDPEGWLRLVRAYDVLGQRQEALDALSRARIALKANTEALTALAVEARQLKLE